MQLLGWAVLPQIAPDWLLVVVGMQMVVAALFMTWKLGPVVWDVDEDV